MGESCKVGEAPQGVAQDRAACVIPRRKPLKRTRLRRKPKTERQELTEEGLREWKAVVLEQAGGRCVRCGKDSYLQAHHIRSVRHLSTKFDPENGLAVCRGCHFWIHNHLDADDRQEFYARYGRDYAALKARSEVSGKGLDLKLIVLLLKSLRKGETDG